MTDEAWLRTLTDEEYARAIRLQKMEPMEAVAQIGVDSLRVQISVDELKEMVEELVEGFKEHREQSRPFLQRAVGWTAWLGAGVAGAVAATKAGIEPPKVP